LTYPAVNATGPKFTYGFDAMGRVNGITDTSSGGGGSAAYGVAGEILSLSYFGMGETRTYNSMFQMTRQTVTNFASNVMDMQYVYTSGANNGRIAKSIDGVNGETVDYTYDVWNRLIQAQTEGSAGVQWGQSYTYDGFGNMTAKGVTKGSAPTFSTTINPATNGGPTSFTTPPSGMDVENRPLGSSTTNYFYDHAGKRVLVRYDPYVWPNYPSGSQNTWEYAMYGLGGRRLVTVGCTYDANAKPNCSMTGKNVYFGGKLVVARGVTVATDSLGTVRANSNGESFAYYPYGEERTSTADGREKFGTYVRDNPNQDYADQRYYNVGTGRFNVPDPYRATATSPTDPSNPGSWNRYSYVLNDPLNFQDQSGLDATPVFKINVVGFSIEGIDGLFAVITGSSPNGFFSDPGVAADIYRINQVMGALQTVLDTIARTEDRLHNPDCAALFGSPAQAPADFLDQAKQNNGISVTTETGNSGAGTAAYTLNNHIYLVWQRWFFTGDVNGTSVLNNPNVPELQGLNMNQARDLALIHELLHDMGVVGDDNSNQRITLGDGEVVYGSQGVSMAIRRNCFH
jgi:RHS repeat-associated protein